MKRSDYGSCSLRTVATIISLVTISQVAQAEAVTFVSGANQFSIEFAHIGNAGNEPDTTGNPDLVGLVAYEYKIGKYEISERMIDAANALGALGISKDTLGPDKPATRVSWFEAAQFVNWLNTSTGNAPAYKFDASGNFQLWAPSDPGYDATNLFRNARAKYFLPSADEWYKAAFYDPAAGKYWDFPNGSDTAPLPVASGTAPNTAVYNAAGPADVTLAGGPSPFGTVGQAGNVKEWEETTLDLINDRLDEERGFRGAAWFSIADGVSPQGNPIELSSYGRNYGPPFGEGASGGFRIASAVPEPPTVALCCLFAILSTKLLTPRLSRPSVRY